MPFQIIRADITKVKADAIVNTANPAVAIGDGVDSAIYNAAGKELLLDARKEVGILEPGEVGITPAFNLDAKYIIHASGPRWRGGDHGETELLKQCYDRSLELAVENGCESIAFPLLATGTYGFPKRLGIETAVDSFTGFLEEHEMDIFLVVFGETSVKISGELGEEVRSFVDNGYVEEALDEEYCHDGVPVANAIEPCASVMDKGFRMPDFLSRKEGKKKEQKKLSKKKASEPKAPSFSRHDEMMGAGFSCLSAENMSLEDALKDMYTDSFEKHLQQYINKKGLKNSEVYAAANISKQYFSKLLKGQVKPSKEKVLALAVGLRLNLDETVDFLRLAGYALSPISQTDVIVEYFIKRQDYSVMKIDIVLFDYGLDPLSKA